MITNINSASIDKHKSILIIGITGSNRYLDTIVQASSLKKIKKVFGECNLTLSYEILTGFTDYENIYLLNIKNLMSLLELSNMIALYNFSYIVPIDVNISDYYNDINFNFRKTYYFQNLMRALYNNKSYNSILIMTDAHASLYEDIDNFLEDMIEKRTSIGSTTINTDLLNNVIFVANNLMDVPYSNVVLAGMIVSTEPNMYPNTINKNFRAIFHIDVTDNIKDISYFKTHADNSTTVENLLTLFPKAVTVKIFTIYRICLYIDKELDFTNFIGSFYAVYKKYQIENIVDQYLNSILNYLITDYEIIETTASLDPEHVGCVKIKVKYSIDPINCAERGIVRMVES